MSLYNTVSIEKILIRIWEVEETPRKVFRSAEDNFCETNFKNVTRRNEDRRYVVTMPIKASADVGSSRNLAIEQF